MSRPSVRKADRSGLDCPGVDRKSCGRKADPSGFCGLHNPGEMARRRAHAKTQWAAFRAARRPPPMIAARIARAERKRHAAAVHLIVSRHLRWCRARLLHALAGAAEQGVLEEVLSELFPRTGIHILTRIVRELERYGWLPRKAGAA